MRVRIHDLSLGGCLLEAPLHIDVGHRLTLQLDLPGDDGLSLQGEAVRIAARSKVAVKFVGMDKRKEHRLQRVIEQLALSRALASPLNGTPDA
jgi:hypothetical protein